MSITDRAYLTIAGLGGAIIIGLLIGHAYREWRHHGDE